MKKLTNYEREEIETLSYKLFGNTSTWQKFVKKGVVESLKDEEGKQVLHNDMPVSRVVYKTEHQVLEQLRELNTKRIALEKARADELERQRQEEEIKKQVLEGSGRMDTYHAYQFRKTTT